jgi:hypothetical protein
MDVRRDTPQSQKSTNEARQGVTGHNVRYVLGIGTVSVIILFGLIYIYYFAR